MTALKLFKPLAIAALCMAAASAQAVDVKVTLTNLAPAGSVGIAPLWVGFHAGNFDSFNAGAAASAGIKQASEDGSPATLGGIFAAAIPGGVQGRLLDGPNGSGPAFAGAVRTLTLSGVDLKGSGRYLSYAAMVVLSNDFFIGNDNATEHDLLSIAHGGKISFLVGGNGDVWDAGTEINDFKFSAANGAFGIGGGQTGPNQGNAENGVVHTVVGNPYTGFLSQELVPQGYQWGNLDFNAAGAFARVDIEVAAAVPVPQTYAMLLAGLAALGFVSRRRSSLVGAA